MGGRGERGDETGMTTGRMRVNRVLVQAGSRERDSVNGVNESHGSGSSKLLCRTTDSEARVTVGSPGRQVCLKLQTSHQSLTNAVPLPRGAWTRSPSSATYQQVLVPFGWVSFHRRCESAQAFAFLPRATFLFHELSRYAGRVTCLTSVDALLQ